MNWRTRRRAPALGILLLVVAAHAGADPVPSAPPAPANAPAAKSLDQLLQQVTEQGARAGADDRAREQRFSADRDQQQSLLNGARARLAAAQARAEQLRSGYVSQQDALSKSRTAVLEHAADIDELRAVVRRAAETLAAAQRSAATSAETPGRLQALDRLAHRQQLPTADTLGELWRLALAEAVANGKVSKFTAEVVSADGTARARDVSRLGGFGAFADGRFLRMLPESGRLAEPSAQPGWALRRLAENTGSTGAGLRTVPIDPTRGALLEASNLAPGPFTRVAEAGAVGYLIIALGLAALAMIAERGYRLFMVSRAMAHQQQQPEATTDNPLGRLRSVALEHPALDAETLGLKLDAAILAEVPALRMRLPLLAVLASAAPLLGLLGTVAGMIQTFQSLATLGAGDPRMLSGGISLALAATELGLLVAIPTLLVHAGLQGVSARLVQQLEHEAAALIAVRDDRVGARAA